jgi:hypothetical protein
MAKKVMRLGRWYIAYECASAALIFGALAAGLPIPGF